GEEDSSAGWSGSLRFRCSHRQAFVAIPPDDGIKREQSWAEDQNDQGRKKVREGVSVIKLARVGKDGAQRLTIRGNVGHNHVDNQRQGDEPRSQAHEEKNSADGFQRGDKVGIECGERDAELDEIVHKLRDVRKLAYPGLPPLPSPIEANQEQKRRLQLVCG